MPNASTNPIREHARDERRKYLFDMLEQLAAMAVTCNEKDVADVLYALVAVFGETDEDEPPYNTASN